MALSVNFFVKQAAERAGVKPAASIHSRSDCLARLRRDLPLISLVLFRGDPVHLATLLTIDGAIPALTWHARCVAVPAAHGMLRRILTFLAKVLASPKGGWEGDARGL
jgi:hypothetical protein